MNLVAFLCLASHLCVSSVDFYAGTPCKNGIQNSPNHELHAGSSLQSYSVHCCHPWNSLWLQPPPRAPNQDGLGNVTTLPTDSKLVLEEVEVRGGGGSRSERRRWRREVEVEV